MNTDREARICAAGIVQSVIASGAHPDEWRVRSAYGLDLSKYMAARLMGRQPVTPSVPSTLSHNKERT